MAQTCPCGICPCGIVVLVGVGCPKQEKWIDAPLIWRKLYLEWFYRFLQEPKRMYKRYFIDDPKFFWYLLKLILGLYKNPFDNV